MKNSSFDIRGGLKIRDRGLGFFYQIWDQDFTSENPSPGCKENNGKLKLTFTSPDVISTSPNSPKSFLKSRIDLTVLLLFEFLKKDHLPVGQVKNRIH